MATLNSLLQLIAELLPTPDPNGKQQTLTLADDRGEGLSYPCSDGLNQAK